MYSLTNERLTNKIGCSTSIIRMQDAILPTCCGMELTCHRGFESYHRYDQIDNMIMDYAQYRIIASEFHLDGKLYLYLEIYEDGKHKYALAQNHQFLTSLLAPHEVIGEVSFNATTSSPNGEGSSVIATSFEKENLHQI